MQTFVKFEGIDDFNRPIFKDVNSRNRYGSTFFLFPYWTSEEEVMKKVQEKDLSYFGTSFGCEPMGTNSGNIKILKKTDIPIKSNDPKIVSMTYSIQLTNDIIKKILAKDFKHGGYKAGVSLEEKLEKRKEIKEIEYKSWENKPGDKLGADIKITILTDSIKKVDPKYNNKYWQEIAEIVNDHLKEGE